MRRMFLCTWVGGLLLAMASPARACINDREVAVGEREFKSSYLKPNANSASGEPTYTDPTASEPLAKSSIGVGVVLMVGAIFVTLRKPPTNS
jgi:hypothetical protein